MQARTASPSRCTVHAPHAPMPQTNLVPVSPRMSRIAQSSGICGSPSIWRAVPLIEIVVIVKSPSLASMASSLRRGGRVLACLQGLEVRDQVLAIAAARNVDEHGGAANQARRTLQPLVERRVIPVQVCALQGGRIVEACHAAAGSPEYAGKRGT